MNDFIKELNITEFLGIGVPGCLLVVLILGDQTEMLLVHSLLGTDNSLVYSVFIAVLGFVVGMLIQEIGDLIEKGLWLLTWLDPKTYAACAVGPERIITKKLEDNQTRTLGKNAVWFAGGACIIIALTVLMCAGGIIPAILSACSAISYGVEEQIGGYMYLGLLPWGGLFLLAITMARVVFCKYNCNNDKIQIIRWSNPYIQTRLVGRGNTSKRTLYDGFRFVMRNLVIVLAVVNLFSLWWPVDLYQQIAKYILSNDTKLQKDILWLSFFFSGAMVIMLMRYYHYSFLRYKYAFEDFLLLENEKQEIQNEKEPQKG